jgi:hypothetical protein
MTLEHGDGQKNDPELRKEIAREAEALLANKAFIAATNTLRLQWYGELMADNLSSDRVQELRAKLMALESIKARLGSLARDEVFAQRGQHAGRNRTSGG